MNQSNNPQTEEWLGQVSARDIADYLKATGQETFRPPRYVDGTRAVFYTPPRPGSTSGYTQIVYDGTPNGLSTAIRKRWLMAPPVTELKPLDAGVVVGAPSGRGVGGAESPAARVPSRDTPITR